MQYLSKQLLNSVIFVSKNTVVFNDCFVHLFEITYTLAYATYTCIIGVSYLYSVFSVSLAFNMYFLFKRWKCPHRMYPQKI